MRNADTYRAQRREAWKLCPMESWRVFNRRPTGKNWSIGSIVDQTVTMRSRSIGRSAYMPHDGGGRMAIDRPRAARRKGAR